MEKDFNKTQYTVVYNSNGEEIARMEGHVQVKPKDYADQLPIEVHHVVTERVRIFKMEK